ncbi:MAG: Cof-type HAD-IIB family hydrolase [Oscillospiraceae bacterium]|nr:Cof-type HAD-IIB family hydrolase [Oscillospiraceae bacterium]
MKYKIIFLDIDGTLTNSQKVITPKTKEALISIQKKGVIVAIASGRPDKGVIPCAEELNLSEYGGYILPYNGGKIINYKTKEKVYQNNLTFDTVHEAYKLSKKYNVELITYDEDKILAETDNNKYLEIESRINKMDVLKVESVPDSLKEAPVKCLLLGDGDYMGSIEPEIKELIGHQANVFRSEPFFLEIMPKGIDKAASIRHLIEKLGIRREETMAFGDGYNDMSMLEYAGMGIAMSNGCDQTKAAADYICDSNDNDGIAQAIDKMFS